MNDASDKLNDFLQSAFVYMNIECAAVTISVFEKEGTAACAQYLSDAFFRFPFDVNIIFTLMEAENMDAYTQFFTLISAFNAPGYGIFNARQLARGIAALALNNAEEIELLCAEVALGIERQYETV